MICSSFFTLLFARFVQQMKVPATLFSLIFRFAILILDNDTL